MSRGRIIGVVEYWSAGVLARFRRADSEAHHSITPLLHHSSPPHPSTTPSLHYSVSSPLYSTTPLLHHSIASPLHHSVASPLHYSRRRRCGFALYEVMIGVTIFALGIVTLGRAVQNCLNASTLSAEESRIREILSNRMAEVQTAPGFPDVSWQKKIDTGYGEVTLIQKTAPANLSEPDGNKLNGLFLVTLTAEWRRGNMQAGVVHHVERSDNVMAQWIRETPGSETQSEKIEFYVYRSG